MTAPARNRKPSASKLIRAARSNGLTVVGVEQMPDGSIRVLTAATQSAGDDDLATLRAERRARKAHRAPYSH
jgi:hypothetical protein